ncbi:hypothetical protein V1294_003069 [Bradyrhizobium sp. AZCC 1678]|uniref:hypothetical protein n=1 Tax=Bradyrhizobium sp. AZCC 1678 TaxID=3117030 RepID=UPI002FF351AB
MTAAWQTGSATASYCPVLKARIQAAYSLLLLSSLPTPPSTCRSEFLFVRHPYLNEKLRADEATSRCNSPMMQEDGPLKPLSLVVGSAELPLLRKQTADFAGHRARLGLPVTYEEISDENHFTILYEMMSPKGRITTLIRQLFERTTG